MDFVGLASLVGLAASPLVGLGGFAASCGLGRAASPPYERSESNKRSASHEGRRPESNESAKRSSPQP